MGRPKKQPAERRTVSLSCRLTMAERLQIEQAAAHAGLTLCEYVRKQVLTGKITVHEKRTLDHSTFDQLRRIGVNLNQLTRLAHQTGETSSKITQAAAAVERLISRELEPEEWNPSPESSANGDGS